MAWSKVVTPVEDVVLPHIDTKLDMIPNIKTLVSDARIRIGEIFKDVVLPQLEEKRNESPTNKTIICHL